MKKSTTYYNSIFLFILFLTISMNNIFVRVLHFDFDYGYILSSFTLIIIFTFLIIFNKKKLSIKHGYYKVLKWLSAIILIPLVSSQLLIYDASVNSILRTVLYYSGYFIFPILVILNINDKGLIIIFNKYILTGIFIIATLFLLWIYSPSLMEIYGLTSGDRLGSTRITSNIFTNLTLLVFCFSIASFIHLKSINKKILYSALVLFIFYYITFGWITRQIILQVFALLIFAFWFRMKFHWLWKVLVSMLTITTLYSYDLDATQSNDFFELITALIESVTNEVDIEGSSVDIRINGISAYFELFKETFYTGIGDNDLTDASQSKLSKIALESGYNLNDLGIIATLFKYGLPSVIFIIVVLLKIKNDMSYSIKLLENTKTKGSIKLKVIAESLYLFSYMHLITIVFSQSFFLSKFSLFYGLLLYFSYATISASKTIYDRTQENLIRISKRDVHSH